MSPDQSFTITWVVPDEEWEDARDATAEHAPGSSYDRTELGRYYLLDGDINFKFGSTCMYNPPGASGINLSLFDLGMALADAVMKHRFDPDANVTYEQRDDDRRIHFRGEEDVIRISANDPSQELVVPRQAFECGVIAFLCELASAIRCHVPALMEWQSLASLREVVAKFCPQ
jgi:hypothetical protein